jgi:hypothetical protein
MSDTGIRTNVASEMRSSVAMAHKILAQLTQLPTPPLLSLYQVSFSSLHCFLKIFQKFAESN